ncbi:putative retrotransposon ty1-copia subclass protein [Tanacetum coccineum]
MELHSLLKTAEQGIKKIDKGKAAKGKFDRGSKRKAESEIAPTSDPKEAVCFCCNTKGHWKRSCPKYLKDLKDGKVEKGSHSSADEEPIVNTDTQQEVVTPVKPDDISLPIHIISGRVIKPPQFYYGFHIKEDKISDGTLSELDESANYMEAMSSPEAAKGKEAMKSKIQSMYDNHMDVNIAFLNEKLTEDVFKAQPEGFENAKYLKRVCKLQKAIYGLKQCNTLKSEYAAEC